MVIYPFTQAVILNDALFSEYGGRGTGSFTSSQLAASYWLAEMQVSKYIGTLLLPQVVTGTYAYQGTQRIVTDYGYVSRLLSVQIYSQDGYSSSCDLNQTASCGYVYDDTFGYIDVKQAMNACGFAYSGYFGTPYPSFPPTSPQTYGMSSPYKIGIAYEAGLPTGAASFPGVLEALTVIAQINLNEKSPGLVGVNEGVGDVGIVEYTDLGSRGYREARKSGDLKRTIFGSSPRAAYAARLLDASVIKARPALRL